jgi:hypothetical protein
MNEAGLGFISTSWSFPAGYVCVGQRLELLARSRIVLWSHIKTLSHQTLAIVVSLGNDGSVTR